MYAKIIDHLTGRVSQNLSVAALKLEMSAPMPISRLVSHVILDLDGTLLNTGD
jgi:hypothetical protein